MNEDMSVDELLDEYFDRFGEDYPLTPFDCKTNEEIAEDVRRCLEENKPAEQPTYEDDLIY